MEKYRHRKESKGKTGNVNMVYEAVGNKLEKVKAVEKKNRK